MAECESKLNPIIAIEIGNVYSGYVYFSGNENHRILTATYGNGLPEDRIPTALLLNSDLSFNSFGTLAKDKYFILTLKGEQDRYMYFENRLQTSIDNSSLQQSTVDKQGSITKEELYATIIEYLYEKCLKSLNENKGERKFQVDDVLLIFLVDETKMPIMRSAVDKARIKKENVRFVHEMDAAASYCVDQNVFVKNDTNANKFTQGYKCVVLDLGGKKSQYCKYEVLGKDKYRKISEVVLAPFGGETVTENFIKEIGSIVGKDNWEKFTTKNKSERLNIRRSFEKHKLTFDFSKPDIIMEMPKAFIKLMDGQNCDGISFSEENEIIVQRKIVERLFAESLREIVEKLLDIKDIDIIFLVGGFSDSSYALDYIKGKIKTIPVILVHKPGLAMLKGAVMMGHKQFYMSEYAYGFLEEPIDGHQESLKTTLKGEHCHEGVFKKVIHINEMVGPFKFWEEHLTIKAMREHEEIVLYKTKETKGKTKACFEKVDSKAPAGKWQDEVTARLRVNIVENVPCFTLEVEGQKRKGFWGLAKYLFCLVRIPVTSK